MKRMAMGSMAGLLALMMLVLAGQGRLHADETQEHVANGAAAEAAKKIPGDPFTLENCPVSGLKIGSMGDPYIHMVGDREIRFCCKNCVGKFEENQEAMLEKIDAQLIEQQLAHYPLENCIVGGGKLGSMGEPANFIYNNRLFRFCCAGCEPRVTRNPEAYFEKLDAAVIEKQKPDYPLETCVVMLDEPLEGMGEPIDKVVANRLVRFCCDGCVDDFNENPAKYFGLLDKAAAGELDVEAATAGDGHDHGDHDHDHHH